MNEQAKIRAILETALNLEIPIEHRLTREVAERRLRVTLRDAAVMVLFAKNSESGWQVLLIQRSEMVQVHKGQFAFPGGMQDLKDKVLADEHGVSVHEVTSLRELHEEVGIDSRLVKVIGILDSLITPTGFEMTPVVGVLNICVENLTLQLNGEEVQSAFWIPLGELLQLGRFSTESREISIGKFSVDVFQFGEKKIWGATGAVLKNVATRLVEASEIHGFSF